MSRLKTMVVALLLAGLLVLGCMPAMAQQTSGLISGTVQDSQGAAVPGAKLTLINQTQGATFRTLQTSADGTFVITPLPPSTYSLEVEAQGFKKYVKSDIPVAAADRVGLPPITLELGAVTDTITVEANTVQLQTVSAERSGLLTGTQMLDLALTGRNWDSLLRTLPGVPPDSTSNINGGRADQNTTMVDGATAVDSGNNGMTMLRINTDAIAEFKVVSNSKQAEFGRGTGANVAMVTKSGSRDFHATAYWFHRNEGMNANSWYNNAVNKPKQLYRYQTFGFNVGGPAYIPGKFNTDRQKLFFFASFEFQRPMSPNDPRNLMMPTALERTGDFSKSKDSSGKAVTVTDPTTGSPFPGNVIPQSRISPQGQALLNWLPLPNTALLDHNYESQVPSSSKIADRIFRIDYNISNNWKFYFRLLQNHTDGFNPYTALNGNNTMGIYRMITNTGGIAGMGNLTTIISPTISNELIYANTRNYLPVTMDSSSPFLQSNAKFSLPLFFNNVDPSKLVPNLAFPGISPNTATMMDFRTIPYDNENPIVNVTDNLSKVFSKHTLKMGIFFESALKRQTAESPTNGTYNFQRDSNNPYDTGWDFSNALTGTFQSFKQGNAARVGYYHYNQVEWYAQDNWKVRSNLTLDYGLRMALIFPWLDQKNQLSTFFPDLYSNSQSVVLYQPTMVNGKRVAINPLTGQTAAAPLIGAEVPGVGNAFNGMATEGQNGISPYLIDSRGVQWGPRFGMAWTPAGPEGKTVVRFGAGVFYERTMGNIIFYQIPNPPGNQTPQLYYSTFDQVASTGGVLFPSAVSSLSRDGHLPTVYNYNLSIQRQMPGRILLDVGYVGSISRHLINPLPINEPAAGSAWAAQNQDPTKTATTDGSSALPIDMYRPYKGYGAIWDYTMGGTSNYNALQVNVNRRVSRTFQFGVGYTWSKALGTASQLYTSGNNPWNVRKADYGLTTFDRTQIVSINYIYNLPSVRKDSFLDNPVGRVLLNGWELSGITSFGSGAPGNLTYNLQGGISGAQLNRMTTGVDTVAPRIAFTCEPNNPGGRTISNWVNSSCLAPAAKGSMGMDSGNNYVRGPGMNNWDMSLFKNIKYSTNESRYIQLRLESFNTFNHAQWQWSSLNSVATFNAATGQIANLASSTNRFGFGSLGANRSAGSGGPRVLQIAAKIYF